MKAAVVHDYTRPLEIEDVPIPEPGAEQVLVRVEASGLCHTDIHAARGEWPVKPPLPFIPGHEGVGVVEHVGPGNAHGIVEGMRVALPWLGYACGDCTYCNSGWETLCEAQQNMGYSMNGGFAEYAVGYARHVVAVPDGIDPLDAAPLTCAGVTTYKAVKISGARSSDLVAVFGAGGLGHLAIQYAAITGAAVVAVDINAERLEAARALGAEHRLEDRQLHGVVRGQPDTDERAAASQGAEGLLERDRVHRRRDRGPGAAEALDRGDRVLFARVDEVLGAELACGFEALGVDVDRHDRRAGDARVLDRQVAEAAGAVHGDEP